MATNGALFCVEEAQAHLRAADAVLARVMDEVGPFEWRLRADPYATLVRAILYQQLAGAAANAIERRLYALFGGDGPPSPAQILAAPEEALRSVGISRQKAASLRDLALHVAEGRLDFAALAELDDAEVTRRLTAVRGLGEWTAQMFLMFHLGRPDVLPVADLGMRNGMRVAYGLPQTPTLAEARALGARWAPYRSVGSWYMWRVVEPVADL